MAENKNESITKNIEKVLKEHTTFIEQKMKDIKVTVNSNRNFSEEELKARDRDVLNTLKEDTRKFIDEQFVSTASETLITKMIPHLKPVFKIYESLTMPFDLADIPAKAAKVYDFEPTKYVSGFDLNYFYSEEELNSYNEQMVGIWDEAIANAKNVEEKHSLELIYQYLQNRNTLFLSASDKLNEAKTKFLHQSKLNIANSTGLDKPLDLDSFKTALDEFEKTKEDINNYLLEDLNKANINLSNRIDHNQATIKKYNDAGIDINAPRASVFNTEEYLRETNQGLDKIGDKGKAELATGEKQWGIYWTKQIKEWNKQKEERKLQDEADKKAMEESIRSINDLQEKIKNGELHPKNTSTDDNPKKRADIKFSQRHSRLMEPSSEEPKGIKIKRDLSPQPKKGSQPESYYFIDDSDFTEPDWDKVLSPMLASVGNYSVPTNTSEEGVEVIFTFKTEGQEELVKAYKDSLGEMEQSKDDSDKKIQDKQDEKDGKDLIAHQNKLDTQKQQIFESDAKMQEYQNGKEEGEALKREENLVASQEDLDAQNQQIFDNDALMDEYHAARDTEQAEEKDEADEEEKQTTLEKIDGIMDLYDSMYTSISDLMGNSAAQSEVMAAYNKAMALYNIGVNTSEAISKGVASAQSVPFPGNLAAIATTIAAVLANMASAKKLLTKEKEPKAPKMATGGLVSGFGSGTSDSIHAMLSNGESVLTARATSMFSPILSAFNQLGGGVPISTSNVSSQVMGEEMLSRAFSRAVQQMPNPVVSVEEINTTSNRVQVLENYRSL